MKLEDRLSLFVEISMEYEKTLDFKYRLNYFEYEDEKQKKRRLGYTVILPEVEPKKKEKKKAAWFSKQRQQQEAVKSVN